MPWCRRSNCSNAPRRSPAKTRATSARSMRASEALSATQVTAPVQPPTGEIADADHQRQQAESPEAVDAESVVEVTRQDGERSHYADPCADQYQRPAPFGIFHARFRQHLRRQLHAFLGELQQGAVARLRLQVTVAKEDQHDQRWPQEKHEGDENGSIHGLAPEGGWMGMYRCGPCLQSVAEGNAL